MTELEIKTTSKGFQFQNMGNGAWKDLTSGITWFDVEPEDYTFPEAKIKFGDKLATKEEFKIAEDHKFREILPNINRTFWSSSFVPNFTSSAHNFCGESGYTFFVGQIFKYSVRCVAR